MNSKDPVLKRFGLKSKSQKMKYDRFVTLYMACCNAVQAYKELVPTLTNQKSIKKAAYLLVRHPYVVMQLRVKNKELDEKMDKKTIMNRERILKELEDILDKSKAKESYNIALKALDQLSRVTGAYAPEKTEVEHKGITINYIKPKK
jgi:hypothetical protein